MTGSLIGADFRYSEKVRGGLTERVLGVSRLYVQGYSVAQVAELCELSSDAVKDLVKRCRVELAELGYSVGNAILLRRAMRLEGLLEGLEVF